MSAPEIKDKVAGRLAKAIDVKAVRAGTMTQAALERALDEYLKQGRVGDLWFVVAEFKRGLETGVTGSHLREYLCYTIHIMACAQALGLPLTSAVMFGGGSFLVE